MLVVECHCHIKGSAMRYLLCTLGIVLAAAAIGTPAKAQNYPWCAQYGGPGGTNCGFTSFEQCMQTLLGMGGFCVQNNWYQPPPGPHQQKSQTQR